MSTIPIFPTNAADWSSAQALALLSSGDMDHNTSQIQSAPKLARSKKSNLASQRRRFNVTQIDIAREVGLPRSTVSYALNPTLASRLSPEVNERVQSAARRLGYRPHQAARVLRGGKSGVIGLITPLSLLQTYAERLHFSVTALRSRGWQVNVETVALPGDLETACSALIDARVEGLIFAALNDAFDQNWAERMRQANIPVVMVSSHRLEGVPLLRPDLRAGYRDLTRHLLSLGHKRLAMLTSFGGGQPGQGSWSSKARFLGFSDAILEAGGSVLQPGGPVPTEGDAVTGELLSGEGTGTIFDPYQPGADSMRKILTRPALPDAILFSNDYWAIGAMSVCAAEGIRVPEDVAIAGCDNTTIGSLWPTPLTSVAHPSEEMAVQAVNLLEALIKNQDLPDSGDTLTLPCRVVVRKSCGAQ